MNNRWAMRITYWSLRGWYPAELGGLPVLQDEEAPVDLAHRQLPLPDFCSTRCKVSPRAVKAVLCRNIPTDSIPTDNIPV